MQAPEFKRSRALFVAASLMALVGSVQADDKSVAVEPAPAFPAFGQWVSTIVQVSPELPRPVSVIETISLVNVAPAQAPSFEPAPLIIGAPELPLVGDGVAQAARNWGPNLNYQGMHMKLLVLNAKGDKRELRPMSSTLRPGERFKIRLTTTFPAVAGLDQIVGDTWYGQRSGQVYPAPGMSVQMNAGESVELPLKANEYFVLDRSMNQRLLVTVRHAKAIDAARSNQPVYRQDAKSGSSYLQLVPRGSYPVLEQLVSSAR